MWMIIILIIIVCLIDSHKENKGTDAGNAVRGSKSSKGSARQRKQRSAVNDEITTYAHSLVSEYNEAYDSHDKKALGKIVEELIGYHYSCASSHNVDDCIALEIAAMTRPYVYKGTRSDCQGLTLIEIYRKQNARFLKI